MSVQRIDSPPRLRPMLEELAGVWELQAEVEADSTPDRRATLRETADALRMLLQLTRSDGIVPGRMHCARCKFVLSRVNLYVSTGQVGAGDNATEPCPNGCGPLWPVTWEQEARSGYEISEQLLQRAVAAEERLARLAPAVAEATAPTMLTAAQMVEGWKADHDCHRSTSAFEWWCAGAIFAQRAHGITEEPR